MQTRLLTLVAVVLAGCSTVSGPSGIDGGIDDNAQNNVQGNAQGNVQGNVQGSIQSNIQGSIQGNVQGDRLNNAQSNTQRNVQVDDAVGVPEADSPRGGQQAVAPPPSPEVALASYLNQSGAVLYDAENCAYCRKQQRLFGLVAFQSLKVVNCGPWDAPFRECRQLGIRTFPTWEIGGRRYPTILPLDEIAEISGFQQATDPSQAGNRGGAQ
ncbi:MAG: hypothetical protein WCA35_18585 [Kovacikia sp.]